MGNRVENLFMQNDVSFVLLRQRDKNKTEVDLFVSKKDVRQARKVLKENKYWQSFNGPIPGHLVYSKLSVDSRIIETVDLHIGGLSHDGILYLPEKYFLNDTYRVATIVVGIILHSIIDKARFKPDYKKIIKNSLENKDTNWQVGEILEKLFGLSVSGELMRRIVQNDFDEVIKLRNRLLFRSAINYPSGVLRFLKIYINRISKVINPFWWGQLVVFIGSDGSGKSTASEDLYGKLRGATIRSSKVYMGWRNSVLPIIPQLMKTDSKVFKGGKKHKLKTKSKFGLMLRSVAITILYFIEMYLRYLFFILPKLKLGEVVITDRYFYDRLILDKNLPYLFRSVCKYFIPKPNLVFGMSAPVKIISKRETNLSIENLSKQKVYYEQFFFENNVVRIDTSKNNQNQVSKKVLKNVWNLLTK